MHGWRRSPDSRSKKAGEAGIEVQACTYSFFMLIHGADPANNIAKHALKTGSTKRGIRRRFLTTRGAENRNIRMSAMKTIINLKRFLHHRKILSSRAIKYRSVKNLSYTGDFQDR